MSETCPKQCPKCGSDRASNERLWWLCDTHQSGSELFQSEECKDRQITKLEAQLADSQRLREEAERERDDHKASALASIQFFRDIGKLLAPPGDRKSFTDADVMEWAKQLTARAEAAKKRAEALEAKIAVLTLIDLVQARQELTAATSEVERLKKLEAAVRDDELIISLVKQCPSRSHDDRYCDWCEGREAGMDQYQSHLLEILDAKEPPCPTT